MSFMKLSSQITFLYFDKFEEARTFFDEVLELEKVYDPEWACVWRIGQDAFIGGVDNAQGSIKVEHRDGLLLSLTVKNIDQVYKKLKTKNLKDITEIKFFEDIKLKSFLFTGPEGYKFEIQQFMTEELSEIF